MTKKNTEPKSHVPAGYNNLDDMRVDLAGFYSPQVESLGEDGDHIYGVLVKYAERRNPKKSQAEGFLIVTLAAPVQGLIFEGDGDGTEGTLEAGWAIGIDIRGAYKMLTDPQYEGRRIHLHFKGKKELPDGNEFWDVGVQIEGGKVRQNRVPADQRGRGRGQSNSQNGDDDIPF